MRIIRSFAGNKAITAVTTMRGISSRPTTICKLASVSFGAKAEMNGIKYSPWAARFNVVKKSRSTTATPD
jgi:hypothetical protein